MIFCPVGRYVSSMGETVAFHLLPTPSAPAAQMYWL